jgi:N-acetylmuramoyl-L-alanine amidase
MSLCDYFDIPFLDPSTSRSGRVDVDWGVLNIRARPDLDAPILAQAPDGAPLTILNQSGGWYLVNYAGTIGYAKDDFVTLN